jgi:hypothetical protein
MLSDPDMEDTSRMDKRVQHVGWVSELPAVGDWARGAVDSTRRMRGSGDGGPG